MYDFIVIGDVLIDRILRITDSGIINSINTSAHTVSLPFPSKVQLTVPPHTGGGGNAYNAAHALQRLGFSTAIYAVIGDDHEGHLLLDDLKSAGVNTEMIIQDPHIGTNSSFILSVGGDKVLFSHHFTRVYKLPDLPETKYVYVTSLGEDDKPLFDEVVAQKQVKGFKILFSPGTRQVNEPQSDIRGILAQTDILVLNKEEAKKLTRLNSNSNETLLKTLHSLGPKLVVMTRSQKGSISYDGTDYLKVGALHVDTVECTGAGDTYAATMLAGLLSDKDLKTSMEWGAINSSNVITQVGVTSGLLDMQGLMQKHTSNAADLRYIESGPTPA